MNRSEIITDGKSLNRAISQIHKTGANLDTIIHVAGVSSLYHAQEHGDVTKASALVHAMPKSSRRKALMLWLTSFAPLRAEYDEQGDFAGFKLSKGKKAKAFDVDSAMSTPFWDFSRERNPAEFTIEGFLASIQKRVKTAVSNGKLDNQGLLTLREKLATLDIGA